MKFSENNKGFTLVELLVVIGIIGLLAGVASFGLFGALDKGRDAGRYQQGKEVAKALGVYYTENYRFPDDVLPDTRSCHFFSPNDGYNCFHNGAAKLGGILQDNGGTLPIVPEDPGELTDGPGFNYCSSDTGKTAIVFVPIETYDASLNSGSYHPHCYIQLGPDDSECTGGSYPGPSADPSYPIIRCSEYFGD